MEQKGAVAVLGATGYIGGRLVASLLARGWRVRAVGRNPEKLRCRPFASHPNVELAQADALDQPMLTEALRGCRAAYYLVHSMYPGVKNFEDRDKRAALIMRDAARDAGLERIIYLGGLGDPDKSLSDHLKSRMEVGEILSGGPVPLTWLRAAMIIGSGSASFEILRYLVDRLPLMITPAWVKSLCQPIAVTNVLEYLVGCLEQPATSGLTLDIGGPDILSYRELFDIYARVAGLRPRIIIPVPVLTPKLSSYWIQMVTRSLPACRAPWPKGCATRSSAGRTASASLSRPACSRPKRPSPGLWTARPGTRSRPAGPTRECSACRNGSTAATPPMPEVPCWNRRTR
jgi:uncharacterized protein YbjT (DUF2867 family)